MEVNFIDKVNPQAFWWVQRLLFPSDRLRVPRLPCTYQQMDRLHEGSFWLISATLCQRSSEITKRKGFFQTFERQSKKSRSAMHLSLSQIWQDDRQPLWVVKGIANENGIKRWPMHQKLSWPVSHNSCQETRGEELRAKKQVVKMAPVVRPTPITIRAVRACWWVSGRSSTKRRLAIARILLLMFCIPKRKMATGVCTYQQCSSICVSAMTLKEGRIDTIHRNKIDSTNNYTKSLNFKI